LGYMNLSNETTYIPRIPIGPCNFRLKNSTCLRIEFAHTLKLALNSRSI